MSRKGSIMQMRNTSCYYAHLLGQLAGEALLISPKAFPLGFFSSRGPGNAGECMLCHMIQNGLLRCIW